MKRSVIEGVSFISPFKHLKRAHEVSNFSMVLAHLVLENKEYAKFYRASNKPKLLDNSFFELGYCLSNDDVLRAAELIRADCIVLKDGTFYGIKEIKAQGYEVMYVPETFEQLVEAISLTKITKIGLSCIKAPKFLGAEPFTNNRFEVLEQAVAVSEATNRVTPSIHLLGATNGMLDEVCKFNHKYGTSFSFDTSLPIWLGLNGKFLAKGSARLKEHCDFETQKEWNIFCEANIANTKQAYRYGFCMSETSTIENLL